MHDLLGSHEQLAELTLAMFNGDIMGMFGISYAFFQNISNNKPAKHSKSTDLCHIKLAFFVRILLNLPCGLHPCLPQLLDLLHGRSDELILCIHGQI